MWNPDDDKKQYGFTAAVDKMEQMAKEKATLEQEASFMGIPREKYLAMTGRERRKKRLLFMRAYRRISRCESRKQERLKKAKQQHRQQGG